MRLQQIAQQEFPAPFAGYLMTIKAIIHDMRASADVVGVNRKFTPDGRFVGDLGELLAKMMFGVRLHEGQRGGQDGSFSEGALTVEVKLRSAGHLIWVKERPGILLVIYMCPDTFRWGVVYNGPGSVVDDRRFARWDDAHKRYETTVSKLLNASAEMAAGRLAAEPCLTHLPHP